MDNNIVPSGGKELIGYKIERYINGKFSRFLTKGVIIDYTKITTKGRGKSTILGGQYLVLYNNNKKYWCKFGDFTKIYK